jgi:hypothetical protein
VWSVWRSRSLEEVGDLPAMLSTTITSSKVGGDASDSHDGDCSTGGRRIRGMCFGELCWIIHAAISLARS